MGRQSLVWILLSLLGALPAAATAEIYRVVDAQGRVTFTDTPPPDKAERVEVSPVNVLPSLPAAQQQAGPSAPGGPGPVYRSLALDGIAQNAVLQDPDSLTVTARPFPPLQAGHALVLLHNGSVVDDQQGGSATIAEPAAGAHVFSAQVKDWRGQVLIESPVVTVIVERENPVKVRPGASRRRSGAP